VLLIGVQIKLLQPFKNWNNFYFVPEEFQGTAKGIFTPKELKSGEISKNGILYT